MGLTGKPFRLLASMVPQGDLQKIRDPCFRGSYSKDLNIRVLYKGPVFAGTRKPNQFRHLGFRARLRRGGFRDYSQGIILEHCILEDSKS